MLLGRYFDGVRPLAHEAELHRHGAGVEITLLATGEKRVWSFLETRFERENGAALLHRVSRGVDTGERLVTNLAVFERDFAVDLRHFGHGRAGEASGRRIALWTGAAVASMALLFFVGLPFIARVAAPLVPFSWEQNLGKSVEPQVLEMFGKGKAPALCGAPDGPGRKALGLMVSRLTADIALPGPLHVDVLDTPDTNAFALPGGRIFVFGSILNKATNPDEVAGVLAHEIGHVVHRDAMRALIHDGTLSVLLGVVLGDVTGGATVTMLGKMMLGSAYSRENERDADRVSVQLMENAGADPRAINIFFKKLGDLEDKSSGKILDAFRSHPVTTDRIETINKLSEDAKPPRQPVLNAAEWAALKGICREAQAPAAPKADEKKA